MPRDTDYATEIATAGVGECRVERIYVKAEAQDEIRFSWWKDGKMMMRPLDLPEDELLELIAEGIEENVFSGRFVRDLTALLVSGASARRV